MTETSPPPASTARREKSAIQAATTMDGRYIPYGGGMMGWFENSGVLKNERGNNYRFHEVIDADTVRAKLFERWGAGEGANRRVSRRREVTKEVNLTLEWGGETIEGTTKDFSPHGLRVQVLTDTISLQKGDTVKSSFFKTAARAELEMVLEGKVMWLTRVGRRRPVWNIGIGFASVEQEQLKQMEDMFTD